MSWADSGKDDPVSSTAGERSTHRSVGQTDHDCHVPPRLQLIIPHGAITDTERGRPLTTSETGDCHVRLPKKVYAVGSLTQFAQGMYAPFMQAYMIDMGASYTELGVFRSVGNVAPTILQPLWGATADKTGRAKVFVALGTLTGLFTVFLFLWAQTPTEMIVLYGVQSLLLSIQIPTWQSLVGSFTDETNRGTELGRLGMAANIASLVATLVSGFIAGFPAVIPLARDLLGPAGPVLLPTVEAWRRAYYLPFLTTAVVGIVASVISLTIEERMTEGDGRRPFPPVLRLLSQPGDFRRFCMIAVFFSFAMSMAWPYFMVVQKTWLGATMFEIAIASAIMTAVIIMFTVPMGRLSDRVGRKPLILLGRSLLFIVPTMYAFATSMLTVYVANALAGFCIASAMNANTAYIYDVAPETERGAHLAVYNTFTGIVFLCGSLVAGFIGDAITQSLGPHGAVFTMLLMSGVLRFAASFLYLLLREPKQYSSTLMIEFKALFGRRHPERV